MSCAACSPGLTGLYLASRLRSGAPWIGRDGVYDLEFIAVVVIGGTLLAGGRGGVWGTLAGVLLFAIVDAAFNMLGVPAYPETGAARRDRRSPPSRSIPCRAHGACRMTAALHGAAVGGSREPARRRVNFARRRLPACSISPSDCCSRLISSPRGVMNFLRRAAPLAILASGQLFVLVSGGFDLSVGSLMTLTVIGGSMLTANDPSKTWWAIAVALRDRLVRRAHQRRGWSPI